MWFDSWSDLLRIVVVGALAYVALVAALRISGKRTLAKLNAFDWVVSVAMGSTLATVILNRDVTLSEGVLALWLLVAIQALVTWTSVRSRTVRRLVKNEPRLVYRRGYLEGAMRAERLSREEIEQAARSSGIGSIDEVEAVVLETDGTFSVLTSVPPHLADDDGQPGPGDGERMG